MTVADAGNIKQYTGNGVTSVFSTGDVVFYDETDLIVTETLISTGVDTLLTLTTDYTVSGGNGSAGSITLVAGALPSTKRITIQRSIPYVQSDDYVEGENILAETLETAFDKSVIRDQQLRDDVNKSLKFSPTLSPSLIGVITETPIDGNILMWDGVNGNVKNASLASLSGSSIDTVFSGLSSGDFLQYNGSTWENFSLFDDNNTWTGTNVFQGIVDVNQVNAEGSAGLTLRNASGTTVITVGAGGGVNTTIAENILVTGSSSAAGHIILREDTDNGTNGVSLYAPASVTADRTITFPDADGTVALTATTLPSTPAYDSGNQTYTAGSRLTIAHSLGRTPLLWKVYLVCTTAEDDFSIGDIIELANWTYTQASGASYNWQAKVDGTNFELTMGASGLLGMNDSSTVVSLTAANFRLRVVAW